MTKFTGLYWVVIFGSTFLPQCKTWYAGYHPHERIKMKLIFLARDLCNDATSKIKSVQYFKKDYDMDPSFHLATMMYKIRTKYAKMKKIYTFMTRSLPKEEEQVFIKCMGKISLITRQLEHDITMIEDWEEAGANLADIFRRGEGLYGADLSNEIVTGLPSSSVTPEKITKVNKKKKLLWSAPSNPQNYKKSKKLNRELQNKFNDDFEQMY